MRDINPWEAVLAAIIVGAVVVWFMPGIRGALERSRKVENPEWGSFLIPLALVALFVFLLVAAVR